MQSYLEVCNKGKETKKPCCIAVVANLYSAKHPI